MVVCHIRPIYGSARRGACSREAKIGVKISKSSREGGGGSHARDISTSSEIGGALRGDELIVPRADGASCVAFVRTMRAVVVGYLPYFLLRQSSALSDQGVKTPLCRNLSIWQRMALTPGTVVRPIMGCPGTYQLLGAFSLVASRAIGIRGLVPNSRSCRRYPEGGGRGAVVVISSTY